jgi:hypothetical protein
MFCFKKRIKNADQVVIMADVLERHPTATHITPKRNEWAWQLIGTKRYEVRFALDGNMESLYYWVDAHAPEIVAVSEYPSGG